MDPDQVDLLGVIMLGFDLVHVGVGAFIEKILYGIFYLKIVIYFCF